MRNDSIHLSWLRRLLPLPIALILLVSLVPAQLARADGPAPTEDQSFTTPTNASQPVGGCCSYLAQTFTAGLSGALAGVSLDISSASAIQLHVTIRGVTNGTPNDTILGERYLQTPDLQPISAAPLSYLIEFSPIYVTAGTQYAVVADYFGGTDPAGQIPGRWAGAIGNPYTGGAAYLSIDASNGSWLPAGGPDLDLHFRTFVVTGVPISDLMIEWVSGAKRAKACQVFSETFRITNLGPDPATGVIVGAGMTDQFSALDVNGVPDGSPQALTLDVGQSMLVTIDFKVVAFVPGESRTGWISASITTDIYPNIAIDPDTSNNDVSRQVRLISKPQMSCQP